MKKPYMLIIRDGWGHNPSAKDNAIAQCHPRFHERFIKEYPAALINTSGNAVGLPEGYQGSSEVGHLNMGAGRVVYQNLVRINKSIREGNFPENPALDRLGAHVAESGGKVHIFGLVQDQGVHAHSDHLLAYLRAFRQKGIDPSRIAVHVITDGRDTPPQSAMDYITPLEESMDREQLGFIASVTGRYYAMDRDNRWERVRLFYDLLARGESRKGPYDSAAAAIAGAYEEGETDEFITPRILKDFIPVGDGDGIVFFNYRFDRAREITKAFIEDTFDAFPVLGFKELFFLATTEYYEGMTNSERARVAVVFPLIKMDHLLGEVLSQAGRTQLRIAETEKYAHVTFFFNGQQDNIFPGEERILVDSPKVSTYDLQPEMSAPEVTRKVLESLEREAFDVIILNYANPDMVGHTGDFDAAVKACHVVDEAVGQVVQKALEKDGVVLLTADHGNAEQMVDPETGEAQTAHTTNPVWLSLISRREDLQKGKIHLKEGGKLADLAPTLLTIMGLEIPPEMDGQNLIEKS
ncbi:MAG TPA: 2,3-bisphosphoglycerate-independent phosphoglycerate mutase [Candidatus Mcinerneyibacteriales bacterium]|nr:2,3-bisphosphoglycerate-independent phosphoglycerate mutase [Candidatus Mcinerneyibacteriales bacterium]